jgi:ATP-binding cassette subfamily C protein CydC/ATP-binding cassette subfamily C protein CydCD
VTRGRRRALAGVVAIAPPDRRLAAATLATGTVALLAGVALLALSGALISKAALRPPVLALSVLIVLVRATGLVRALARYGERLASHDLAFRALARLRSAFFARLVGLDARAADGDLLSRFVGDVDQLQALYLRALGPPAVAAITSAVTVLAAAVLLPAAALALALGLLAAGVLVPLAVAALARRAAERQAAARAHLSSEVLELVRHAPELAVAGRGADRLGRVAAADEVLRRIAVRDAIAGAAGSGLGTLVQGLTLVAVLAVAVPAAGHALDAILLAALAFLTLAAFEATAPLGAAAQQLAACGAAAERVTAVLDRPPAAALRAVAGAPHGALALEAVTARPARDAPIVLDAVDLRIAPGEAVALVGPSGAGKTTLARLLVDFAEPERGRVTLGGTELHTLDPGALRHTVRLIASDEALFTTTVAENVRLARPDATDGEVRDALDAVGLGPWLATLPDGLKTMLGEDGATVSGGQRRRIAVARALLADARFLIVDEPGEHLDRDARAALLATLVAHARARGQGLLAIVHDDALEAFDRVHELRAGQLT